MKIKMTTELTASQQRALKEILSYIRRERIAVGTHLPESQLANLIGTSRSPIRVALNRLVDLGLLRYDKNRGYSLSAEANNLPSSVVDEVSSADDPLYLALANMRFKGEMPDFVMESDLTRMLNASRSDIRKVLTRAQSEGWVEKETGYGWRFLPMIDSLEAYDDMYALRVAIEPAGILNPKFQPDYAQLRELRREQQGILDGGYATISGVERFEANVRFHEAIAEWSGNKLAVQTLRRFDQMRRLTEYRQAKERLPLKALAQEHLSILDAIETGDSLLAASLMRQHLDGARRVKAVDKVFRAQHEQATAEPDL
jgi:DNA-binding GntR family transcriptional regulator